MVFGSRTAPPPDSAALAAAFQYRERIAGQPSPFFASGKYQGEKAGYEFKTEGERGAGYYRSHAVDDQFLARLERAEARDVHMATGGAQNPLVDQETPFRYLLQEHHAAAYKQPVARRNATTQDPQWARVQAEGLTETTNAYQHYNPPAAAQRVGVSRQRRSHFAPQQSQIDLSHPTGPAKGALSNRRSTPEPNVAVMRPAGGRANLAGPSNRNGTALRHSEHANFLG